MGWPFFDDRVWWGADFVGSAKAWPSRLTKELIHLGYRPVCFFYLVLELHGLVKLASCLVSSPL